MGADSTTRVSSAAASLVAAVREEQNAGGTMQSFLHHLSSQEGVLLMRRKRLRIPDTATADRLIRDKFSKGDWTRHLGASRSWLVNAGTWGLMLSGKMTNVDPHSADISDVLARLGARLSEPMLRLAVRQAMKIMAEQFVMGRTIEEALQRSGTDDHASYRHSFDMLGEAALTYEDAQRYFDAYVAAIKSIGAKRHPAAVV